MPIALQSNNTVVGASISLVQSKTAAASGNTTSISVTLDATPTAGNLLVVIIADQRNQFFSGELSFSSNGWQRASSRDTTSMLYRIAGANESATLTVTLSQTGAPSLVLAEYSGITTDEDALDQRAFNDEDNDGVTSLSSGTTQETMQSRELLIAAVGVVRTGVATSDWSWSNNFTARDDVHPTGGDNKADLAWADRVVTARDSYETTASWTTAYDAIGIIATFKGSLTGLTVVSAPTDGSNLVIHRGYIRNRANTATVVSLREGRNGTVRFTASLAPDGGQTFYDFGKGWRLPSNVGLVADISQSTVEVNVTEYYESGA